MWSWPVQLSWEVRAQPAVPLAFSVLCVVESLVNAIRMHRSGITGPRPSQMAFKNARQVRHKTALS